jgi:hypothetical protein
MPSDLGFSFLAVRLLPPCFGACGGVLLAIREQSETRRIRTDGERFV